MEKETIVGLACVAGSSGEDWESLLGNYLSLEKRVRGGRRNFYLSCARHQRGRNKIGGVREKRRKRKGKNSPIFLLF